MALSYLADVTTIEQRSRAFGQGMACSFLAIMLGPLASLPFSYLWNFRLAGAFALQTSASSVCADLLRVLLWLTQASCPWSTFCTSTFSCRSLCTWASPTASRPAPQGPAAVSTRERASGQTPRPKQVSLDKSFLRLDTCGHS